VTLLYIEIKQGKSMPGVSYYLGIPEMPAISHNTGFQIKVHADIIF